MPNNPRSRLGPPQAPQQARPTAPDPDPRPGRDLLNDSQPPENRMERGRPDSAWSKARPGSQPFELTTPKKR